jgi:hypothetical protein
MKARASTPPYVIPEAEPISGKPEIGAFGRDDKS